MSITRKQITFDLDTNLLKAYYPKKGWRHAYEDIKDFMLINGFEWIEGSVYVSKKPLATPTVSRFVNKMIKKHRWLNICMRDCRVTEIMETHSLNHLFNKNADIPKRIDNNTKTRNSSRDDFTM